MLFLWTQKKNLIASSIQFPIETSKKTHVTTFQQLNQKNVCVLLFLFWLPNPRKCQTNFIWIFCEPKKNTKISLFYVFVLIRNLNAFQFFMAQFGIFFRKRVKPKERMKVIKNWDFVKWWARDICWCSCCSFVNS